MSNLLDISESIVINVQPAIGAHHQTRLVGCVHHILHWRWVEKGGGAERGEVGGEGKGMWGRLRG